MSTWDLNVRGELVTTLEDLLRWLDATRLVSVEQRRERVRQFLSVNRRDIPPPLMAQIEEFIG